MAKNAPKPLKAVYLIKASSHLETSTLKLRLFLELGVANETKIFQTQAKLAEAKVAAAAATDRPSFEKARKLFIEARQIFDRAMKPLKNAPKMEEVTSKTPTAIPAPTTTTPPATTGTTQ